jgi:hypothetical protein
MVFSSTFTYSTRRGANRSRHTTHSRRRPSLGRAMEAAMWRCYNSAMGMKTVTRRLVAWIACFSMLFGALAPSIAHAMAAANGDAWAQVCSTSGTKLVKIGADPVKQPSLHVEHCPFCATHAGPFALLPGARISIAVLDLPEAYPLLFLRAPHPLSVWTTAQSRAPPSLA